MGEKDLKHQKVHLIPAWLVWRELFAKYCFSTIQAADSDIKSEFHKHCMLSRGLLCTLGSHHGWKENSIAFFNMHFKGRCEQIINTSSALKTHPAESRFLGGTIQADMGPSLLA